MKNIDALPKVGWLCSYSPLEILHAAGLLPVRVFGHGSAVRKADSHMHPNLCPYVRSVLDVALEGGCGHLRGMLFVNSCDAMRRLRDVFLSYVDLEFNHLIDLPRGRSDADAAHFKRELKNLKSAIEKHFGVEITEEALRNSIEKYKISRELYAELNNLRKETPPRISGAEIMRLGWLIYSTPPEIWNENAETVLNEKKAAPPPPPTGRQRILLTGNLIHSPNILEFVEDCGLDVVYDDTCTGSRFFELPIAGTAANTDDPLGDLARAYLFKPACARMMVIEERAKRIIEKSKEFDAAGIIHHTLKFCDTYLYDVPILKNALNDAGFQTLFVEGDCTLGSFGQLKTRIEAFAEILEG
ncbi:MAG: 2-hydroxyacyl-CoA dehydratase family protein [bacterium]